MSVKPSQVLKLLQAVVQPVYLVDGHRRLVFCNHALEQWTGCEASQLLGQVLRYHTPPSRLRHELVAAALCPPPESLEGRRGIAVLAVDLISRISRRRAEFLPLAVSESETALLVLVDATEWNGESDRVEGGGGKTLPEEPENRSLERREAAELHRLLLEERCKQRERFAPDRFAGTAPSIRRLRQQIESVLYVSAPVLILGEPGCGKEHLARTIHFDRGKEVHGGSTHGGSAPGGFVPVDCGLLDPELIVSTLLAFRNRYVREGKARSGERERDGSGTTHTLFLSNADLFPVRHFPFLAEWLANAPRDQRVLATSPLGPEKWKTDHAELYALLGTFVLEIPPLRERRDEIPLFAQRFLESRNARGEKQLAGFTAEALDLLSIYRWPGNLAEMETMIGEAWEAASSGLVGRTHLPERLHHVADALERPVEPDEILPLESFLLEMERELLERALRRARGNKSGAARLLGLTRPKLYRRLEVHGLLDTTEPGS